MTKGQALVKALFNYSFQDKAMMKYLLNWIQKLPKEAFVDENVYTFKVPRGTYGRQSNRMSPHGQRIRAKQQTVTPLIKLRRLFNR